ncbi:MAG: tetratricopeptide (TPR) repeat protein [Cyclobacteriaceae bacterium]|jgi:tetratricopeptide (TPR) repeat protein
MSKHQVILLIAGVIAVVLLYQLPTVVVENDQITDVMPHVITVSNADNEVINSLRIQLKVLSDKKKSINFADSLARVFLKYQMIDSAQEYAERVLALDTGALARYTAGMILYQSFQNTPNQDQARAISTKARSIFERLLSNDPENSALKNKVAMTLMISENPMQGVMMLREILDSEPVNREAIFNLGMLAIRSGQYDRAGQRFQNLIELDEADHEAYFYLGVSYAESGQNEKGTAAFQKYIEFDDASPALRMTATNYIKELENI